MLFCPLVFLNGPDESDDVFLQQKASLCDNSEFFFFLLFQFTKGQKIMHIYQMPDEEQLFLAHMKNASLFNDQCLVGQLSVGRWQRL